MKGLIFNPHPPGVFIGVFLIKDGSSTRQVIRVIPWLPFARIRATLTALSYGKRRSWQFVGFHKPLSH